MKFCLLCRNIFSLTSVFGEVDGAGSIARNARRVSDLVLATSAELIEAVRRVHARRLVDTPDLQARREKALGFSYMGYNLMVDPLLDGILHPAQQFVHDWMHCCFVSGVWSICVHLLLQALWRSGVKDVYASLQR